MAEKKISDLNPKTTLKLIEVVADDDLTGSLTEALLAALIKVAASLISKLGDFTVGSIPFATDADELGQDNANLFWDNSNKRFGIGTNSPSHLFDIVGSGNIRSNIRSASGFAFHAIEGLNQAFLRVKNVGGKQAVYQMDSTNDLLIGYDVGSTGDISIIQNGVTVIAKFTALGNFGINTTSPTSKLHVTGINEFADNAAAIIGGLTIGAFYRTGDLVKIVH